LLITFNFPFNQLDLPEYTSWEQLQEHLLLAIHEASEGFGFGWSVFWWDIFAQRSHHRYLQPVIRRSNIYFLIYIYINIAFIVIFYVRLAFCCSIYYVLWRQNCINIITLDKTRTRVRLTWSWWSICPDKKLYLVNFISFLKNVSEIIILFYVMTMNLSLFIYIYIYIYIM